MQRVLFCSVCHESVFRVFGIIYVVLDMRKGHTQLNRPSFETSRHLVLVASWNGRTHRTRDAAPRKNDYMVDKCAADTVLSTLASVPLHGRFRTVRTTLFETKIRSGGTTDVGEWS